MPAQPEDDAELMRRVQRGDLAAFETLVDRHRQAVINFASRMLQDLTEAEDIAQAAFVQVYKAADRYQTSARFTTWLFTITRNLCLNELRRRSRHPADSLDQTRDDDPETPRRQFEELRTAAPPDALLREELTAKVEEAVGQLPENQRAALLLYQRDDLSYEEICGVLGCSLSATKSLIHRARETLKRQLKPYLRTGAWPGND
jgi:RNA polymerase sigma-70 factor (ECF subfamily)